MGAEQDLLRGAVIAGPDVGEHGEPGQLGRAHPAGDRVRAAAWAVYAAMGVILLGYLALLTVWEPSEQARLASSGWGVDVFELAAGGLCLTRGLTGRSRRAVPLTLGLAITSWSLGDIVLTVESQGGVTPPVPSLADVFYLGFYPLAYVATVIFIRGETRRLTTPSWLDGAVATLGTASVCAAFVFDRVLHLTGGDPAATATNLAYPVGDVLLLSLVVGGSTVMSGRRKAPWLLMASGLAITAVGDTANLFGTSFGASRVGFVLNAIAWPVSLLLLSVSVWLRPRPADLQAVQKPASFVIPGVSAASALAVLFVGNLHETSRLALGLATAALLLAGIRLAVSVRGIRSLSQERRQQSVTDDLTGLGNRRCFNAALDSFFADYDHTAEQLRTIAFLFVDLNHFKEVNDTFGHSVGDRLLKQLGPRLATCVRRNDLLIRLGGDEFVVVLVDAGADFAITVAQRLTEALADPFIIDTVRVHVDASIGIAVAPADAADAAGLLWCADVAMYRAKLAGAPFVTYQSDLDKVGDRLMLLHELRTAIDEHQLVLHYQPQLDLRTSEIVAVESLLRWVHPRLGIIGPMEFLPLAEEAGLMGPITARVLTEAIAQCAAWRDAGSGVSVSVNIAPVNLLDPRFTTLVRDLMRAHQVPPEALVLEITETTAITHFDRSQSVVQELRDLGIVVSIDDFGAGFTSLGHLSNLAVRELKLDRVFIAALGGDDRGRALELVRATIDLGHALGLRIVAEGIEDSATLELLSSLGCDLAQGAYISTPKPANLLTLSPTGPVRPASPAAARVRAGL
ncbi:MAG TPA: bifunctional diguanylate cyclase/phosphodiesterase [Streptosporangiaceae bacterium]|nr:bifunctional diguanylate cyclase/phosphodiesterase [Streptosporangiaceae bacterium]